MIDTHAHVHDQQYDDDREATLDRARAAGIASIVTIGCDLSDSERALRTAETYALNATIGIHPHEAKGAPADIAAAFDRLRAGTSAPIVAIGETGLDYHYNHSPAEDQRRVMRAQIAYARAAGLPVVFHQREAFDDFVADPARGMGPHDDARHRPLLHRRCGASAHVRRGVRSAARHRRRGDVQDRRGTARGRSRRRPRSRSCWRRTLRTWRRFRTRGKRNEPAFVLESARTLAATLDLPLAAVETRTDANARRMFGLV